MAAGENYQGPRCGAKTRKAGLCPNPPVTGRTRCRMHGGATPRGIASPQFVHGRRSRDLPTRLLSRYQDALEDEQLLELASDVALIDTRLGEVLSQIDSGETGRLWAALRKAWATFTKPIVTDADAARKVEAFDAIRDLIEQGATEAERWAEISRLTDQRARLAQAERQRHVQLQQTITVEQAMTLLAAVEGTVRRHVTDQHTLTAISGELGRLVALQPVRAARPQRAGDAPRLGAG